MSEHFCEKHNERKVQIDYGRGKWGHECKSCLEEERKRLNGMFPKLEPKVRP